MKTVFLRVLEADEKAGALLAAIREPTVALGRQRFEVDAASFAAVPGSPFAYWVSEKVLATFASFEPLNHLGRLVVSTNPLNADFRYVRAWWEVPAHGLNRTWRPWAKGGAYSPIYYDIDTVIRWDANRSTYAGFLGTENRPLQRPASVQHFFRPGLTWPRRTNGLSLRAMPAGCIFADKGPAVFVEGDHSDDLLALAAVTNSRAFGLLVSLQLARTELAQSYEVGLIQNTPVPRLSPLDRSALVSLSRRAWSLKRSLDTRAETSHAFTLPALLQIEGDTLTSRISAWTERVRTVEFELTEIQGTIDELCFELYGIDEVDRRAIAEGFGTLEVSDEVGGAGLDVEADEEGETSASDVASLAAELVSWAAGVVFGRFDVGLAAGGRAQPREPEPFDPLPMCSPAMLAGPDGLPLPSSPAGYPLAFPDNGILVDDPGHPRDLTSAVRAVFDSVFGARADAWWSETAAQLDPKDHELRSWLSSSLFEHHLKRHSKSRRKAPVLWQLGTPSGRYSVWLYAHRLTRDSVFQLQNDVVAPKLAHEERRLTSLVQSAGDGPSAKERKEIAGQGAFVEELRGLLDEVKRVTSLWNPTFDDGIVLAMTPLWRLVPQHKPWQRELKTKWAELEAGKHDWAHLAMHLWPERVVPGCVNDRSLAIAHGLEDMFWIQDFDGQWRPLDVPMREMNHVADHWASSSRVQLLSLARDLWQCRYRDGRKDDRHWFEETELGANDEHPLALRLWPRRICERAVDDDRFAKVVGLRPPIFPHTDRQSETASKERWLERMSVKHGVHERDRAFLRSTFSDPSPAIDWRDWWVRLDDGSLDELPAARYVRSAKVATLCQESVESATAHEVLRFFFVDSGLGLRGRLRPVDEAAREVSERTSRAVKAALKSLLEAPIAAPAAARGQRLATTTSRGASR